MQVTSLLKCRGVQNQHLFSIGPPPKEYVLYIRLNIDNYGQSLNNVQVIINIVGLQLMYELQTSTLLTAGKVPELRSKLARCMKAANNKKKPDVEIGRATIMQPH